jgi:cyclophilin family peptidyl-prolyl cis-trans isomerase
LSCFRALLILAALLASVACGGPGAAPTAAKPVAPPPAAAAAASPSPSASAGGSSSMQWSSPPAMAIDQNKQYNATIDTNVGSMKAQLYVKDAPNTVNNFVFLARQHFYDGVPFHRIIANFMVQTGDPTGSGRGGPGYRFNDELPRDKDYDAGTLAMANAGPNTQGSQFFIVHANPKAQLPKNYTIFGKLTDGMDILDKIAKTPVKPSASGEPSVPTQDVHINSVTIEEK